MFAVAVNRRLSGACPFILIRGLALAGLLAAGLPGAVSAQDANTKWMRLWNGKDLTGWKYQSTYWKVADSGMIIATGHLTGYNTFCYTDRTFADFELSVRARLWEVNSWYTNSGIQYRSRIADSAKKIIQGPQADIGDGASASMYPEGGYGGPGAGSSSACRTAMKKSNWNHYLITANGSKVSHKLNQAVCNDFTNTTPAGVIGLQMHFLTGSFTATSTTEVNFKDVFIRPLNNSFTIPDSLAVTLNANYEGPAVAVSPEARAPERWARRTLHGLQVAGLEAGARLSLRDPLGRTVATGRATEQGRADLGTRAAGARFLRAER